MFLKSVKNTKFVVTT